MITTSSKYKKAYTITSMHTIHQALYINYSQFTFNMWNCLWTIGCMYYENDIEIGSGPTCGHFRYI